MLPCCPALLLPNGFELAGGPHAQRGELLLQGMRGTHRCVVGDGFSGELLAHVRQLLGQSSAVARGLRLNES